MEASCFIAFLNMDRRVIGHHQLGEFWTWVDERAFQSPRVESEFDCEWPRPSLVSSGSRIGRVDRYTKRICSLGLFVEAFESVAGGLLHCIDSIETLVEGEGWADFQHCSNHRTETIQQRFQVWWGASSGHL